MASFWKTEACCQTVLPDRSVLIAQKLVENAKIQKSKCDILSNFQTMCCCSVTKYKIEVKTTSWLHSIKMVQSVNYALVLALVLVSFVWGQMRNNRQLDHFLPPPPARFNERQILRNRPRLDFEYESDSSGAADTDLISRWVTSSVNESLMMKISLLQKEWCKSTLTSSHQNILIK